MFKWISPSLFLSHTFKWIPLSLSLSLSLKHVQINLSLSLYLSLTFKWTSLSLSLSHFQMNLSPSFSDSNEPLSVSLSLTFKWNSLSLFLSLEAIQNGSKSVSTRLEQRSVIKSLVADKCKPYDIFRRMSDMYREVCFSQKKLYLWARYGFATMSLSRDSLWSGNTNFPAKKKLCAAVSKGGLADSLLGHEKSIIIDFLEKGSTVNSTIYYQLF